MARLGPGFDGRGADVGGETPLGGGEGDVWLRGLPAGADPGDECQAPPASKLTGGMAPGGRLGAVPL